MLYGDMSLNIPHEVEMELCNMSILRKKHKIGKLTFPPSLFKPCLPACTNYLEPQFHSATFMLHLQQCSLFYCEPGFQMHPSMPIRSNFEPNQVKTLSPRMWGGLVLQREFLSFNFVNGLLSRSALSKPWHIDTFYKTDEDWVMFEVCGILSSLKSTTSLPPMPSSGISRGPHFAKVQQQPWTRYPVATGSRHSYLMTVESPTQSSYLMINRKPTVCTPRFNSMVLDYFTAFAQTDSALVHFTTVNLNAKNVR